MPGGACRNTIAIENNTSATDLNIKIHPVKQSKCWVSFLRLSVFGWHYALYSELAHCGRYCTWRAVLNGNDSVTAVTITAKYVGTVSEASSLEFHWLQRSAASVNPFMKFFPDIITLDLQLNTLMAAHFPQWQQRDKKQIKINKYTHL